MQAQTYKHTYMRLSELNTGEKGVIIKVLGHGGFRKRIVEMGFIKGNTVEVILNAPLKDPIKYRILGYEISLRRQEAAMIEIVSEEEAKQLIQNEYKEGITEETDEEEETKQEKSSSSSSSSSTKSSAAGSEETITIERSSSSETTTSDSNNTSTSTSYTTNQYYFILSDENSEVMQEVFEQMGIENITREDSDTAEDTSDGDEQDTVVSVSSDVTAAAVSGQAQTLYSDAQNGNNSSNDILLYYIIFGISLLIVLRVISLVRMPRRRPSDQEDDL